MYLNRVELIGFLGSDAETKTTPNGKAVTTWRVPCFGIWNHRSERG